jgi:hypothetical protein
MPNTLVAMVFTIFIHILGSQNQSADALSQLLLFKNLNSKAQLEDLSTVDLLLNKDGDDLMEQRLVECEMFHMAAVTHAKAEAPPPS